MKQSKKGTVLCGLESLKSTIFQDLNKILGGHVPPPNPPGSDKTGKLIDIVVNGKVVGHYYRELLEKINAGV